MRFKTAYDPARALGGAWRVVRRAPLPVLLAGIVLFFTGSEVGLGLQFRRLDGDGVWDALAGLLGQDVPPALIVGGMVSWVLNCFFQVFLGGVVRRTVVQGRAGPFALPSGSNSFHMIVATLLRDGIKLSLAVVMILLAAGPVFLLRALDLDALGALFGLGLALLYIPLIVYIYLGLSLTVEAVAIEGLEPVAALRRSWKLAEGNRLRLLLFAIVGHLVSFAGFFLLCVGVFFTYAWVTTAWFEGYVRLVVPTPEGGMGIDRPSPRSGEPVGAGPSSSSPGGDQSRTAGTGYYGTT